MNKELLEHLDEFRFLFKGGKLSKKDGWRNVIEHQVIQFFGAKTLGELMGLSDIDKKKLQSVALIHDGRKRLDKYPQDFSADEIKNIELFFTKINPDSALMAATGTDFLEKVSYTEVSSLELLQFYLDDITKGNEIVPFDERINEVSRRRQDLNDDEVLTARLGGKRYWDVEREIGHAVEKMIFRKLVERGVEINSPENIPSLISSKIKEITNE